MTLPDRTTPQKMNPKLNRLSWSPMNSTAKLRHPMITPPKSRKKTPWENRSKTFLDMMSKWARQKHEDRIDLVLGSSSKPKNETKDFEALVDNNLWLIGKMVREWAAWQECNTSLWVVMENVTQSVEEQFMSNQGMQGRIDTMCQQNDRCQSEIDAMTQEVDSVRTLILKAKWDHGNTVTRLGTHYQMMWARVDDGSLHMKNLRDKWDSKITS